jgi:hypothetical protein
MGDEDGGPDEELRCGYEGKPQKAVDRLEQTLASEYY